jgi:energy-coupling factor transporter ATP-binding protein EcfA2
MPDQTIRLKAILLSGFRAYLEPKTFDFAKKPNLAIFAPNGSGKSSVVDSVEFLLSKDGTIERLGIRATANRAGVTALAHDLAQKKGIASEVGIVLQEGATKHEGKRPTAGDRVQPDAAILLKGKINVDPVIRGYALRRFVEEQTTEDRYTEVGRWLQLTPLVEVQKSLRALRTVVKTTVDDLGPKHAIDARAKKASGNVLQTWSSDGAIAYALTVVQPLDPALKFKALNEKDDGILELAERAKREDTELGLAGLRQIKAALETVYLETKDDAGTITQTGAIPAFETAVSLRDTAAATEAAERDKAANAVFAEVWKSAEPLFADGAPDIETCPVCNTSIKASALGNRNAVRDHIKQHREQLAEYAKAKAALDKANGAATTAHHALSAKLAVLLPLIPEEDAALRAAVTGYQAAVQGWANGAAPNSTACLAALRGSLATADAAIDNIEKRQGENTYRKAKARIDSLIEIAADDELRVATHAELIKLQESLNQQATFVSGEIRKKVQGLLDTLRKPLNDIYRAIQGAGAAPVYLELPAEDDTTQQRLSLLVDFSDERKGVQPSGYLSDSQIHSLALALRLAAISVFNTGAPIAVLDDVVTSYDADHRRAIVAMMAEHTTKLQIILTTHDQRFFAYLKEMLPDAAWNFTQIIRLEREYGPRFADHRVTDEMIELRWQDGKSAANEMRQAEEEWLLDCCRGFGVDIRIRDVARAYSYERSELAQALATFLKGAGLTPPEVPGVTNRFLASLAKGEIENFGSHFQDGPYGDGSMGDEKVRWAEFVYFRDHFSCPACSRKKFKRPLALKKPVCAHDKCETPFQFPAPKAAAG